MVDPPPTHPHALMACDGPGTAAGEAAPPPAAAAAYGPAAAAAAAAAWGPPFMLGMWYSCPSFFRSS